MADLNWHRLAEGEWAASFPGHPHVGDFDGEYPDGSPVVYPGSYVHAYEDTEGQWWLETITDECEVTEEIEEIGTFPSLDAAKAHAATLPVPALRPSDGGE